MKGYFLSLLGASFAVALVGLLAPDDSGKMSKSVRLMTSLFLICVIAAPLPSLIHRLPEVFTAAEEIGNADSDRYSEEAARALEGASRTYFASALTQLLETRFSLREGDVRCSIRWAENTSDAIPERVTVILSGSAIWKDPAEIEAFLHDLLGCECVSAIDMEPK